MIRAASQWRSTFQLPAPAGARKSGSRGGRWRRLFTGFDVRGGVALAATAGLVSAASVEESNHPLMRVRQGKTTERSSAALDTKIDPETGLPEKVVAKMSAYDRDRFLACLRNAPMEKRREEKIAMCGPYTGYKRYAQQTYTPVEKAAAEPDTVPAPAAVVAAICEVSEMTPTSEVEAPPTPEPSEPEATETTAVVEAPLAVAHPGEQQEPETEPSAPPPPLEETAEPAEEPEAEAAAVAVPLEIQAAIVDTIKERAGVIVEAQPSADAEDPFASDKLLPRHPDLLVHSEAPFVAETPAAAIVESYLTPNELFFVRNHHAVPDIDTKSFELQIVGNGIRKKKRVLTLDDLRCGRYEIVEVTTTLQGTPGVGLAMGAISTATWKGVRLQDVLRGAGYDPHKFPDVKHVHFQGLDGGEETPYGASIPIEKAMNPIGDVILAWEMNGVPLPPDHGYPLRVIVPGVVGARNVKWLGKIELSDKAYKNPSQEEDNDADWSLLESLQELPVESGICSVEKTGDTVVVRGFAWSGGGRGIVRVDVSGDGGASWTHATLAERPAEQKRYQEWGLRLWEVTLPSPEGSEEMKLVSKAIDTSFNVQPESAEGLGTLSDYLSARHYKMVDLTSL